MEEFREAVWEHYRHHKRELPWRDEPYEPYKILVSEVMLQQTQASRVVPKYDSFLSRFPSLQSLAEAQLADVLREWSGLGYNRRAKYLHDAAKQLSTKTQWTTEDLEACKGIGKNTAAAVITYSYNLPVTFIETNIRTVFIHYFFSDHENVSDKEILPLVEDAIDKENPREWYWALMDLGAYIKKTIGNAGRQSRHYSKQSEFKGSLRQIRGRVLKELAVQSQTEQLMAQVIPDERLGIALSSLQSEGLIIKHGSRYSLAK